MAKVGLTVALLLVFCPLTVSFLRGARRLPIRRIETDVDDDPAPTPSPVPESWFRQKLDHFDPADNRYWQQRYYINDTFYQPGGPMFLSIGGEDELQEIYARTGDWMVYAEKYHALCFALEHRYYGQSRPTANLSTDNLQYLTMEQALEDLATFITVQNKQHNMTDAKWIVFGGSYAGMMAAWMRSKFPHLVSGAVAHSATIAVPVINTDFAVAMGEDLHTESGCFEAVTAAFDDARTKLKTDAGTKSLQDMFGFCDFDRNNPLDVENVMFEILNTVVFATQYSDDDMRYLTGWPIASVSDMCKYLTDKSLGEPLSRLANYGGTNATSYYYGTCYPVTFASVIAPAKHLDYDSNKGIATNRAWNYQLCIQVGDFVVTSEGSKPFGKTLTTESYVKICEGYFGPKFDLALTQRGNDELVMNYGGLNIQATNVVYTQGGFDPFHKIGFNKDNLPRNHVIVVPRAGHVTAMLSPSPLDSPALTQARTKIQRYIGQWISDGHGTLIG